MLAELYFEEAYGPRVRTVEQAFDYLERARQWFPLEQRVRIQSAIAHVRVGGKVDRIADVLRDALRTDPNRADLLEKLVIFEMAMGDQGRAHPDAMRLQALTHRPFIVSPQLKQEQ